MPQIIELKNIRKSFSVARRKGGLLQAARSLFRREYDKVRALDGISFSVAKGEIAAFIGPNGAGKSTAIKIMGGILVPDSGECTVMGICPWKERKRYVARIGVVFGQRSQLWWDVPVQDSLDLLKDIYRVEERRFRENLEELSELLELGPLLRTPLRQLSLGQKMRCEIAASLLHDPEVLFLDEPTIGLDAVSKLAVRKIIARLNRERKITVILSSHDMDDIESLTERALLIGKGKLIYDGPLGKLRERYGRVKRLEISFEGEADLPGIEGALIVSQKEGRVIYEVDSGRTGVSRILSLLGEKLPITDLSVVNPPIEEIIASVYREGDR
ncbi:MAG: ATP-binding cassette domain-containing protein [Spirochaetaceae bacterium]|jgi:ABC-2 type transport system ATP-binding protein|nr:ATP-binding cassette domain-containing protein [Spirochaetaceae bacterium]